MPEAGNGEERGRSEKLSVSCDQFAVWTPSKVMLSGVTTLPKNSSLLPELLHFNSGNFG